jgi:hypothetical protein
MRFLLPLVSYKPKFGVEPTKAWITLSNQQPQQILKVKIYDESTTPANYTFLINDAIKNYISWECDNPVYWCQNKSYIVPAGMKRADAMTVDFLFMKKTENVTAQNFTITARAQPISNRTAGTVGIVPQVTIDIYLNQVYIPPPITTTSTTTATTVSISTTTTQSSGGGNSDSISNSTSNSTTTTTSTTSRISTTSSSTTDFSPNRTFKSNSTTPIEEKSKGQDYTIFLIPAILIVIIGILAYFRWVY